MTNSRSSDKSLLHDMHDWFHLHIQPETDSNLGGCSMAFSTVTLSTVTWICDARVAKTERGKIASFAWQIWHRFRCGLALRKFVMRSSLIVSILIAILHDKSCNSWECNVWEPHMFSAREIEPCGFGFGGRLSSSTTDFMLSALSKRSRREAGDRGPILIKLILKVDSGLSKMINTAV